MYKDFKTQLAVFGVIAASVVTLTAVGIMSNTEEKATYGRAL